MTLTHRLCVVYWRNAQQCFAPEAAGNGTEMMQDTMNCINKQCREAYPSHLLATIESIVENLHVLSPKARPPGL